MAAIAFGRFRAAFRRALSRNKQPQLWVVPLRKRQVGTSFDRPQTQRQRHIRFFPVPLSIRKTSKRP